MITFPIYGKIIQMFQTTNQAMNHAVQGSSSFSSFPIQPGEVSGESGIFLLDRFPWLAGNL